MPGYAFSRICSKIFLPFYLIIQSICIYINGDRLLNRETTILEVPCLTLRDNTERPVTCEIGSNRLVGTNPTGIIAAYHETMREGRFASSIPPLWDGHAAERIVEIVMGKRL
jgi:UDP-N-acetylglucosamine 2-epimerase (non-hydrolysing)